MRSALCHVLFIATVLLTFAMPLPAVAETIKVYVLAGQSNMAGHGLASELPDEYRTPREDVRFASLVFSGNTVPSSPFGDQWKALQPGSSERRGEPALGPEIGFGFAMADAVKATAPGERIAIIKFARGGANLHTMFHPKATEGPKLYPAMIGFVNEQVEVLKKEGHDVQIAGFCWYQGEADCTGSEETARAFGDTLKLLMESVRRDLNEPALPFVAARVNPGLQRHVHKTIVRDATASVTEADERAAWVNVDDLNQPDKLHLDAAGQIEAGKRMAEAVRGIESKTDDRSR